MTNFRQTGLANPHRSAHSSARHHHNPISKVPDFREICRQEQDGDTAGTFRGQPISNSNGGSQVETAGRMAGKNDVDIIAELAGNDKLLLIAAREFRHAGPWPGGTDVIGLDGGRRCSSRSQRP